GRARRAPSGGPGEAAAPAPAGHPHREGARDREAREGHEDEGPGGDPARPGAGQRQEERRPPSRRPAAARRGPRRRDAVREFPRLTMAPRRVHLLTLGCPKNQVDSEIMLGVLARRGHELVLDPEAADVLVVNTCSFIQPAKEESIDAILELARVKAARPGRRLVVTGCLAQRYADELKMALPEVDVFVGTGDLLRIAEAVEAPAADGPVVY